MHLKRKKRTHRLSLVGLGSILISAKASAGISWSGIIDHTITGTGGGGTAANDSFPIDFDNDTTVDFNFSGSASSTGGIGEILLEGASPSSLIAYSGVDSTATNYAMDDIIDSSQIFGNTFNQNDLAYNAGKGDIGNWVPAPQRGYAGVAFDVGGNTHYGWLDISVTDFSVEGFGGSASFSAILHSYAWEDVADTAIQAGHTGVAGGSIPEPGVLSLFTIAGVAYLAQRSYYKHRSST